MILIGNLDIIVVGGLQPAFNHPC